MPCGIVRRVAFSAGQLAVLFGLTLPLPIMIFDFLLVSLGFGTGAEVAAYVNASFYDPGFHLNLIEVSAGACTWADRHRAAEHRHDTATAQPVHEGGKNISPVRLPFPRPAGDFKQKQLLLLQSAVR